LSRPISAPAQLVLSHLVIVSMTSASSGHNVDLEAQRDVSHPMVRCAIVFWKGMGGSHTYERLSA
jgi:hypothetical protein